MKPVPEVGGLCPRFHRAVELIGMRWAGAIIHQLMDGRRRYAALKSRIPGVSDRMLSERLRALEEEGLLTRLVTPDTPVRVEYELTTKGRDLATALNAIGSWATKWLPETEGQAVRRSGGQGDAA